MATTTVKLLHLRSGYRPITTSPTPIRFFSSSNPSETPNESSTQPNSNSPPPPPPQSQSPYSNYLSDVKARLKQQQPGNTRSPGAPFSFSSNIKDVEEMRKRLSEFRQRFPASAPPSPPSSTSQSSQHISLGKIYERVTSGGQESSSAGSISYGKHSWLDIKEKLNKVRNTTPKNQNDKVGRINDSMSLSRYQESLSLKPGDRSEREPMAIGGGANLASSIFAKELGEKQGANVNGAVGIQFAKIYKPEDLGEKLRSLRPEKKGKNWFSLEELNERLKKVREIDEEESKSATGETQIVRALKDSLVVLSNNIEIEKGKAKNAAQKMDILAQLGRTPSYTSSPPQEHLVKQFFHPDNMSASEKLKLELKKVRDEFKMSESDCGSARVQVAQLTTKIKHLSAVLHKKDKHSKKGLQGMVQQRKKLLKYLRRTDWESYCFVLTKLGLRDNPDYKS